MQGDTHFWVLSACRELIRRFGEDTLSCIESETDRILVASGFPYGVDATFTFPDTVNEAVTKAVQRAERDLEAELTRRRDFRQQCVFTIDPRTARDLDDALHVRRLLPEESAMLASQGAPGAVYEVSLSFCLYLNQDRL